MPFSGALGAASPLGCTTFPRAIYSQFYHKLSHKSHLTSLLIGDIIPTALIICLTTKTETSHDGHSNRCQACGREKDITDTVRNADRWQYLAWHYAHKHDWIARLTCDSGPI